MKIYTKTGDKGETSLVGGKRVKKYAPLLEAYGSVDELNAWIGLLIADKPKPFLTEVQRMLFTVGGMLATEPDLWQKYWQKVDLDKYIQQIEEEIDRLSATQEPFKGFVLPQGSTAIAHAHLCRTVCRRVERPVAKLVAENKSYLPLMQILNRLSDYFFILSNTLHQEDNVPTQML